MPDFGDAERNIKHLLSIGELFYYNNREYIVRNCGKPTCRKGEPKTDIYILAEADGKYIEFKISFKKENADFIENKMNSERAEALLGANWQNIIIDATESIATRFENKKLIYKRSGNRTEEGSITLGWKYELLNKSGGELSGIVHLSREQVIDVYAGTHLPMDKRDASVCGEIIENSGIANCILMNDSVSSAQEVIDNLIPIEKYVDEHPTVYFACKALNYRTYHSKYDGNRPLSVFVDWNVENGMLSPSLVFDYPLEMKGDAVADKLLNCMETLHIRTTQDINDDIITNPSVILE